MNLYHFGCIYCVYAIFKGKEFVGCASGTTKPHTLCDFKAVDDTEVEASTEEAELI